MKAENTTQYKLQPVEQDERRLFFRLDGEAAERHGAIGYLRADFGRDGSGFFNTWFDNQGHLKTPTFKTEFDRIITFLRGSQQKPMPFTTRRALEDFCRAHEEQSIENRGVGFKIQTDGFTYYARCWPARGDYEIYVFAYDNRYLLPELAGQNDLPESCYSTGSCDSMGEFMKQYPPKQKDHER